MIGRTALILRGATGIVDHVGERIPDCTGSMQSLNIQRRGLGPALLHGDARPAGFGRRLTVLPYPRRIPAVLSVGEVTLLLRAVSASEVTRQCSSWKLSRSSPVVSTERADAILP
jgi:hypothetical protein